MQINHQITTVKLSLFKSFNGYSLETSCLSVSLADKYKITRPPPTCQQKTRKNFVRRVAVDTAVLNKG
nr:MAG TPA: hypothetical protein [Caudoviricetes sp.]